MPGAAPRFPFGLEALLFGGDPLSFADGPLLFGRAAFAGAIDQAGLNGPPLPLGTTDMARLLGNLRPTGDAWPDDPATVQGQALLALAATFARLHARSNALVFDAFPGTTTELLPEWEASVGLPDACAPLDPTLAARRRTLVAKLVGQGGASIPNMTAYAAALGSIVTVSQFAAFRAEASAADDAASDDNWAFAWQVNLPADSLPVFFRADEANADDPLATFQSGALECRLRRIAPAHTTLLFHYADGETDAPD